jgi:hypothetical protein
MSVTASVVLLVSAVIGSFAIPPHHLLPRRRALPATSVDARERPQPRGMR